MSRTGRGAGSFPQVHGPARRVELAVVREEKPMSVKIRLRRMGRKKQPHYRVVVADSASPRDGRFVENLGYYRPLTDPAHLVLDLERFDYWVGQGALPSDTVATLVKKARKGGGDDLQFGVLDPEEEKAKRAEKLAARRKAEKEAAEKEAAEEKAKAEAEKAAAEAEAKAAAEAEAAAEEEAAPEAEASADEDGEAAEASEEEKKEEG